MASVLDVKEVRMRIENEEKIRVDLALGTYSTIHRASILASSCRQKEGRGERLRLQLAAAFSLQPLFLSSSFRYKMLAKWVTPLVGSVLYVLSIPNLKA